MSRADTRSEALPSGIPAAGGHMHPRGSYGLGLPGKAVAVCHQVDRGQRLP
jgi:hypothetical protein